MARVNGIRSMWPVHRSSRRLYDVLKSSIERRLKRLADESRWRIGNAAHGSSASVMEVTKAIEQISRKHQIPLP
jgi:hypothetical protein